MNNKEQLIHDTQWLITKYHNRHDYDNKAAYAVEKIDGNICVNTGINLFWNCVINDKGAEDYFDHDHAMIGVGDSDTSAVATQTELEGDFQAYAEMDTSFPTAGTDQKVTFKATFTELVANFSWQEFCIVNYNPSVSGTTGVMLNRKVSDKGTKNSGEVWEVSVSITLS
jgi:hypothetical protein